MPPAENPLEHSHTPEAIARRLENGPSVSYLRDWVYGGIDGAVTTFAIVAGSIGANLSPAIVLVLGVANLLADGFSMAAANYTGTKSELEDFRRLHRIEEKHVRVDPAGEREEIRQIFLAKGIDGADLDHIVRILTSRPAVWIDTMMREEYGLAAAVRSPMRAALATFAAFVLCGSLPLLPFVLQLPATGTATTVLTGSAFFLIGSIKARWSTRHWFASGVETTAIGLAAAGIAYFCGHILQGLFA
ncbi:membrane protein [Roseibium aquae]|uniref:Membrane protein n=1 Tax=Roseibium aquae TaxID=1323746 RepID=A0A916TGA4_9HYPH|nr:VIT1/CCC1 transporter family protein [Roseibium aquae]GGB42567.1 membrane protein [Roseibium aquae]